MKIVDSLSALFASRKPQAGAEARDLSQADSVLFKAGRAQWSTWTVASAVRDGFRKSGWIYRAVTLIARGGASVPWAVFDAQGQRVDSHPISRVLVKPNPHFSGQDLMELLLAWHLLAGWAYLKKVRSGRRTVELWPISPDRLAPVPSREPGALIDGYAVVDERGVRGNKPSPDFPLEDVIHFKLLDPADPIQGIGPLQAAAKAVDIDVDQHDWQKASMQNRGVLDLLFSFKQDLDGTQAESVTQRIMDRLSGKANARKPLVIGSQVQAQKLGLTPAEMDWIKSRESNREEIFIIFGIPPQYGGAFSTYNNFATARRVLWEDTIIPLLDDVASTLNWSFADELGDGYRIGYDLSNVKALAEGEGEKAKTANSYWSMGVPVAALNDKLGMGLEAFPDWDKPWTGRAPAAGTQAASTRSAADPGAAPGCGHPAEPRGWRLIPVERRDLAAEQQRRDDLAEGPVLEMYQGLLDAQRRAVFKALEDQTDPAEAIAGTREAWGKAIRAVSWSVAEEFAGTVAVGTRGRRPFQGEVRDQYDQAITDQLNQYLDREGWMLRELSHIEATTVALVLEQLQDGIANGRTVVEIQQAIEDVGAFGSPRALLLARTLAGTAASIGQIAGATVAGAQTKEWMNSGFDVREIHIARGGERVPMDGRFSDQGYGAPRYPLDPNLGPADRVNCRCSMVFD